MSHHGRHPPAGRDHDRGDAGQQELADAGAELGRPGPQVDEADDRDDHEGLQHLGDEPETDEAPASISHRVRPSSTARTVA